MAPSARVPLSGAMARDCEGTYPSSAVTALTSSPIPSAFSEGP